MLFRWLIFFESATYIDISNVIAKVFLAHYSSKYGCRKARFSLKADCQIWLHFAYANCQFEPELIQLTGC